MPSTGTYGTRVLLRPIRAILKPLATQSAYSPIETIVLFSVIGTLAYFHILSAIKHSSFLAPRVPSTLRPNHALLRDNEWVNIRESTWYEAVQKSADSIELQQFVFSLPPPGHASKEVRIHPPSMIFLKLNSFFFFLVFIRISRPWFRFPLALCYQLYRTSY
jgi:hypothetical protein